MTAEATDPTDATDSAALVTRIQAGDRAAEAELVERYGRGVAVVLRQATRGREVAEDLYQETFRLALEKIRRRELREPGKLPAFLGGLARNLARDLARRDLRRSHEGGETLYQVPDPAPDQLGRLLRRERAALVRDLLDELPVARDRELLLRVYLSGDDKQTICAELGLSDLHFNRVLFRARQRYKEAYEKRVGARAA